MPACTDTVPFVVLNATLIVSLPLELPVFSQVPRLVTVPAVPAVLWIKSALPPPLMVVSLKIAPASSCNTAPLFRSITSLKLLPTVPVVALLPCSSNLRSLSVSVVPLAKLAPPSATVAAVPLPLSVLAPEKVAAPLTVSVPVPVSVPPDSVSDVAVVLAPLRFSVPPLIVVAPSPGHRRCRPSSPCRR